VYCEPRHTDVMTGNAFPCSSVCTSHTAASLSNVGGTAAGDKYFTPQTEEMRGKRKYRPGSQHRGDTVRHGMPTGNTQNTGPQQGTKMPRQHAANGTHQHALCRRSLRRFPYGANALPRESFNDFRHANVVEEQKSARYINSVR